MQMSSNMTRRAAGFAALAGMVALVLGACQHFPGHGGYPPKDNGRVELPPPGSQRPAFPPGTKFGLLVNEQGNFVPYGPTGNPADFCRICTSDLHGKYGRSCEKAPDAERVCKNLGITLTNIDTITVIKGVKNPDCTYIQMGNYLMPYPPGCCPGCP